MENIIKLVYVVGALIAFMRLVEFIKEFMVAI